MDLKPLLLLFIGGVVLTAGDIVMKKWVISDSSYLYIIGIVIYMIGMNFLAVSFKYKNIAVASTLFVLFNVITLLIVSWVFFKERLSVTEIIGVALGLASVTVLELSS